MSDFDQAQHFVAVVAWGNSHAVTAVDREGKTVLEFEFGPFGWREFQEKVATVAAPMITSEFMFGNVVDQLAMRGYTFYPINANYLRVYLEPLRNEKPDGGKPLARLMAEALRTHGRGWKAMTPADSMIVHFREAWAEEKRSRDFFVDSFGHLQNALKRVFPQILPVFDWTWPAAWHFVSEYPTPGALRRAKRQHVEKFLRAAGLADTPVGQQCMELVESLHKANDVQSSQPGSEDEVRKMADLVRGAGEVYQRAQTLTAQIVQVHPDYKLFGPPTVEEPAPRQG